MNKTGCSKHTLYCLLSGIIPIATMAQTARDPFVAPSFPSTLSSAHAVAATESDQHDMPHIETPSIQVPVSTVLIPIQYATTADILKVIQDKSHPGLLSEKGWVSVDPRTNTLIVRDEATYVQGIQTIVKALDVPVRQVQIEARIVTMSEDGLDEMGIRWGERVQHHGLSIGGNLNDLTTNYAAINNTASNNTASQTETGTDVTNLLNVNLPATSGTASTIAFQIATLGTETLLDLELSALQSESKAEVISSPRLLTTNRQPAFIEQGTEIPYVESTSDGDVSVAFKKAVLSLEVTPNITPDHHVILDLRVTQDRPGEVVKTGTGEAVAIVTQRIGTQVLVNDGETVVLGGIYQKTVMNTIDRVPVLGELPILGKLFRRTYQKAGKNELLIFVTTKLVIQ